MSVPLSVFNSLYSGAQYHNTEQPIWASALTGISTVGPNLQVSSITLPSNGALIMENTAPNSASIIFDRPIGDLLNTPSLIAMSSNAVPGGNVANISIINDTKTFYDNLALGDLLVYGNNSITNPSGLVGSIGQYQNQTAMSLNSPAVYTSSIWISTINGVPYSSGSAGPNIQVSTLTVNDSGAIYMTASGTSTSIITSGLFFDYSADLLESYRPGIKMTINNTNGALGVSSIENISITKFDAADGIHYNTLALGDLLVYGTNNPKLSTIGQVALIHQYTNTTDVEVVTTGFHTDNLIASTVNGYQFPGSVAVPTNILVSSIQVNATGSIVMDSVYTSTATANLTFNKLAFLQPSVTLSINSLVNRSQAGVSTVSEVLAITRTTGIPNVTRLEQLGLGELLVYGRTNPITSTIGQVGRLTEWSSDSTDLLCITSAFRTASTITSTLVTNTAYISTLFVSSIVDYAFVVSSATVTQLVASNISSTTASVPFINASTISFEPSLGGVKFPLDLGLGEFLGAAAGTFAGETVTMTLATGALLTGLVGMIAPRTNNNIYVSGEPSTFQTINMQTQLQFSTIGQATSTFYRFVSSTDGLNGTVTPGFEYIVSSVISANTLCIRSFADPLNLANPSTFTSTVQSFGYWVPVPLSNTTSTIIGNFNVTSTLTASSIQTYGIYVAGDIQANNLTILSNVATGKLFATSLSTTQTVNTSSLTARVGNISSLTISTINGAQYPPLLPSLINTSSINASSISTYYMQTTIGSISSLSVSSINGSQFNPGGLVQNGTFSTIIVSSLTTTSSINATQANITFANIASGNVTVISSLQAKIGGVSISTNLVAAQDFIGSSFLGNIVLLTNLPTPGLTLLDYTRIQTSGGTFSSILSSNAITTNALNVSSINGQIYPPAYNSTLIGNFNVTSTLTAYNVLATNDISALSNVFAETSVTTNGYITGGVISGTQLVSFGGIVATTSITGDNATIGGVVIGAASNIIARQINASNITISTINNASYPPTQAQFSTVGGNFIVRSTLTAYAINCSTNIVAQGNITGATINSLGVTNTNTLYVATSATIPVITGLTQINGSPYPPPVTSYISTFNQLFASSFQASTIVTAGNTNIGGTLITNSIINAGGTVTAPSFSSAGNYNGLSATYPGVNISLAGNGNINAGNMLANAGTFISTNVSSFFVSSINSAPYPPANIFISSFSTITVSSLATVGSLSSGNITASGGVIGGVTLIGGAVTAALITGAQVNTNSITVGTNVSGNAVIAETGISYFSTVLLTGILTGAGVTPRVNISSIHTDSIKLSTLTSYNVITSELISILKLSTLQQASYQAEGVFSYGPGGGSGSIGWFNPNNILLASSFSESAKRTTITDGIITTDSINTPAIDLIASIHYDTLIRPGLITVDNLSLGYGVTSINGGQVYIAASTITGIALVVQGTTTLEGAVTAAQINNERSLATNTYGFYFNTNQLASTAPTQPFGVAALSYAAITSGMYDWGNTVSWITGLPYAVPYDCLLLSRFTTVLLKVIIASNRNAGGIGGPSGGTIYGVWEVLITQGDSGVAIVNITAQVAHNVSISFPLVSPTAGAYVMTFVSSVNVPYVSNVRVSWTLLPLEPPPDVNPNPFVP